jgi:hypothetical protein
MDEAGDITQLHFMDSRLNPAGMTTSNQPLNLWIPAKGVQEERRAWWVDSCWNHAAMTSKDTIPPDANPEGLNASSAIC